MTPLQIEKTKKKILKIKSALAADKRRCGFYDDSRGLRYDVPGLYIKLNDYNGALKYFKWFEINFPDDSGFPIFLFEWTLTLFITNDFKGAEKKALKTFFSNTYLIDHFLGKKTLEIDKYENSNWQNNTLITKLKYSKDQQGLVNFVQWLELFMTSDKFYRIANEFFEIEKKLLTEPVGKTRTELVNKLYSLEDDF